MFFLTQTQVFLFALDVLYSPLLEHYEKAEKSGEGILECAYAHNGLGLLIRVKYERGGQRGSMWSSGCTAC